VLEFYGPRVTLVRVVRRVPGRDVLETSMGHGV
jgi:hypothetical protein